MKDLPKRALTGVIGVSALLGCIYYNQYTFGALFLLITVLGLWEFYGLLEKGGYKPLKIFGTLVGAIVFVANYVFAYQNALGEKLPFILIMLTIPLAFLFFFFELFKTNEYPFTNISFSLSGIIYIAFPFAMLNYIVMYPNDFSTEIYHSEILISYFFLLWANDTGAYFAGNFFGKNKLFERISPKKTWEGSIGGFILSLIMAGVISKLVPAISLFDWLVIAAIIVVFGTLGDLVESFFKRGLGIKDSGNILPGHGGVLDRFDSLLLSIPFVFVYLKLFT